MIVYIAIGNSDDKLSQRKWASFQYDLETAIRQACAPGVVTVHGRWASLPDAAWQNACWCIEFIEATRGDAGGQLPAFVPVRRGRAYAALGRELSELAGRYVQESIAWTEVAETEFLAAP